MPIIESISSFTGLSPSEKFTMGATVVAMEPMKSVSASIESRKDGL